MIKVLDFVKSFCHYYEKTTGNLWPEYSEFSNLRIIYVYPPPPQKNSGLQEYEGYHCILTL